MLRWNAVAAARDRFARAMSPTRPTQGATWLRHACSDALCSLRQKPPMGLTGLRRNAWISGVGIVSLTALAGVVRHLWQKHLVRRLAWPCRQSSSLPSALKMLPQPASVSGAASVVDGDCAQTVDGHGDAPDCSDTAKPCSEHVRADHEMRKWSIDDLEAIRVDENYLFTYKMHDLHIDNPIERVTLQTQLCHVYPELIDQSTAYGFRLVHQLDYATSGVLCVALTKRAARGAASCFMKRLAKKCYLALVTGHTEWDERQIELAVGDDVLDPRGFLMALEGDAGCIKPLPAATSVFAIARGWLNRRAVTKLLLCPVTGRRHQLRLHCRALGYPIVGDVAYAQDRDAARMMLHAWLLHLHVPKRPAPMCVESRDPFALANHAAPNAESVSALGSQTTSEANAAASQLAMESAHKPAHASKLSGDSSTLHKESVWVSERDITDVVSIVNDLRARHARGGKDTCDLSSSGGGGDGSDGHMTSEPKTKDTVGVAEGVFFGPCDR